MKKEISCLNCGVVLSKPLTPVELYDAYDFNESNDGTISIRSGVTYDKQAPEQWIVPEMDSPPEDYEAAGPVIDYTVLSELSLLNITPTNKTNGCCAFDRFDIQCQCGEIVGYGKNDCWQNADCRIDQSKITVKELPCE